MRKGFGKLKTVQVKFELEALFWSGVRENCIQPQGMNPLEMTQIA